MLCYFSAVQQGELAICVCVYIYTLSLRPPSYPPPHPTPLGHHRASLSCLCYIVAFHCLSISHMYCAESLSHV